MKRLRELRIAKGLTQAELARQLGTTQQTVGRWEKGQSSPSLRSLEHLAYLLDSTVPAILGQRLAAPPKQANPDPDDEESSLFWGHIGLRGASWKSTQWYPINEATRRRIWSALRSYEAADSGDEWVLCETLNNRFLAFKPESFNRIWLLDDACDGPTGDWNARFVLDDYAGNPTWVYDLMEEWLDGKVTDDDDETRRDRIAFVDGILKKADLFDETKLIKFLHHTKIYANSGEVFETWIEPKDLWNGLCDLEMGFSRILYFPGCCGEDESFFPVSTIFLIDSPLADIRIGQKEVSEDD